MIAARLSTDEIANASSIDIGTVARMRGLNLKRQGREFIGPCPVCGGVDRFAIHRAKQLFHCRGCDGKGRGAISLVMFLDSAGFREAVETLTGRRAPSQRRAGKQPPAEHC